MEEITLKQLCSITGVSRRMVQRYETYGLLTSTRKNRMNHNLYDSCCISRVEMIRFFQHCGYKIKEISELFELSYQELADSLAVKLEEIKQKQAAYKSLEEQITQTIEKLRRT